MNISNASCEYFYDEEYDVAIHGGTYNQPFINSINNNNCYPCPNNEINRNQFKHNFRTTSQLWSDCIFDNSENNNYHQSNDNLESSIFKCISSDNLNDTSRYSLSKNLPFLNETCENACNYHLYFEKRDSLDTKCDFDIRKHFARRYNSKTFIDSGKCSAATSDSLIHPFKQYRNEIANSENNLHETSLENLKERSDVSQRRKPAKQFWRKLKNAFSKKKIRWKKIVEDNGPVRLCRSYSAPSLTTFDFSNDQQHKNNRFSTTIVELYNLLNDLCSESNDSVFIQKDKSVDYLQCDQIKGCDVSCQYPETIPKLVPNMDKRRRNLDIEYPGIGKMKLPHKLRISICHIMNQESVLNNLKFLESPSDVKPAYVKRSNSTSRIRGRVPNLQNQDNVDKNKKSRVPTRCVSECRRRRDRTESRDTGMKGYHPLTQNSPDMVIIEENRSVSFLDLRPIPRKWGLSNDNQILAIFEAPGCAPPESKSIEYDEESSVRIGGLVANAIAAIKLVTENVSSSQDIATICDTFVRCKDSNRQRTSALLVAVDTILALISDGLSIDSLRLKRNQTPNVVCAKTTMRLWMFVEESCRNNLIKDVSQKLAFANLIKQVKQVCGNTVPDQRSKEWLTQLKLQIFIVIAIKQNILHLWLRAIVGNDTILHRFFSSCSFFQQARTTYSNALSIVVMEIKHLSSPSNSTKQVKANTKTLGSSNVPNTSFDNSASKSKIPRANKKSCNTSKKL